MQKKNKNQNNKNINKLLKQLDEIHSIYAKNIDEVVKKEYKARKLNAIDYIAAYILADKIDKIITDLYADINTIVKNVFIDNIKNEIKIYNQLADGNLMFLDLNIEIPNLRNSRNRTTQRIRRKLIDSYQKQIEADILRREIGNVVYYNDRYGYKGSIADIMRTIITENTKMRSQVRERAIEEMLLTGLKVQKEWLYTFRSKEYRESHLLANGKTANDRGYFYIDGIYTKGPGLFGFPEHDINCQCDIAVIIS